MSQASNKIRRNDVALQKNRAFARNLGSDIFDMSFNSLGMNTIENDCSIVKRSIGQMPNMKDIYLD